MLNIAFNSKILCVLLILCGFSSTVLSSIDDKDELNPSVHVPYKFIKPVDLQQTDYNTTCDYRSQNWGMHLMTSCTQEADYTEACQGFSYLISYPGVLPKYLDDNIAKKMTLITINNFNFYYYSYNDNNNRLCSLYIYYLNKQMDISIDTFRLKYDIDSNFNNGSLKDTARQIFDFRRNHVNNRDSDIINCPIVPAPENTKSINDLAQFIMAKNHVFFIDDNIDNDDVGEFNRFWKSLDINVSSGKTAFAQSISIKDIHSQLKKMYKRSKLYTVSFENIIFQPEKITESANKLLNKLFSSNAITNGRQALNNINDFNPFNILTLKTVSDLKSVPTHVWQKWDGIICVTSGDQYHNHRLLNIIKTYQKDCPLGQVFWLGSKFTAIPPEIITKNFHKIPGNPQKILPKLRNKLAWLHTIANIQVADDS